MTNASHLLRRLGARRAVNWRRAGPSWLPALVLAVLLGPWLGALHQIVHLRPAGAEAVEAAAFKGLFGQHATDADCLAYDQLSHGDALHAVPVCLAPLACPGLAPWFCLARAWALPIAAFDARAPPA